MTHLPMSRKWETLCKSNFDLKTGPVDIKWFIEGETNICYNCLDRWSTPLCARM